MKKLLLLFVITLVIGCHENETGLIEENTSANRSASEQNPYEYVGVEHNLALGYLMDKRSTNYTDAVNFIAARMDARPEQFIAYDRIAAEVDLAVADGEAYFNTMALESDKVYVEKLSSILTSASINTIERETSNLVTLILNDNSLDEVSEVRLLGLVALAKHTFMFWDNYENNNRAARGPIKKFWADACGFYYGFQLEWQYSHHLGDSILSGIGGAAITSAVLGNR